MRTLVASFLAAHLAACAPRAAVPAPAPAAPDRGTPADVHTAPGRYDGYEIVMCDAYEMVLVVKGSGPVTLDTMRSSPTFNADVGQLQQRGNEALAPFASFGFGIACAELGLQVFVEDYRSVDAAMVRLIPFLRDEGLGVPVIVRLIPYRTL